MSLPTPSTAQQLEEASLLYQQQNWPAARQRVEALLASYPDFRPGHELLGLVYAAQGDRLVAQNCLETASLLGPLSAAAQLTLGDCYLEHGFEESAKAIFRHLAQRNDLPADCLGTLAAFLGRTGQLQAALDVCRRAAACFPEAGEPLMGTAYYMGRLGYPPELIVGLLRRAVSLAPERLAYRLTLVRVLTTIGQKEEAQRLIQGISTQRLSAMRCAGCLRQLEKLYDEAGDAARAQLCRRRAAAIAAAGGSPHIGCEPLRDESVPRPAPRRVQ